MKPRAFVAAVGDANDPVTWSGIPYHFLAVARAAGLMDEGLPLSADGWGWRLRRAAWNASRGLAGDRLGGYQYSSEFLEKLWAPVRSRIQNGVVLNCFQLFAPSIVRDPSIERWFFIDQTLLQLFDHYKMRPTIGRVIADAAVELEREGYHAATGVIAHSRWAAASVIDYGIAPDKVHVVVPGANLDPLEYARWEMTAARGTPGRPLRLVFIGKEWWRKGLDRLLGAFAIAREAGSAATLRVIGCPRTDVPRRLQRVPGVEWLGFIDKRREAGRFLRAVSECDIGCVPSRAEAGGIAIREYHALGLVVLGTDSGGAPEHMLGGASLSIPVKASNAEFANILLDLGRDRERFERLAATARANRRLALWEETIDRIGSFWPHLDKTSRCPQSQRPMPVAR